METLYSIYPYEVTAASRSKHELEFPDFSLILLPASTMVRWMTNKCVTVLASFITFNVVAFFICQWILSNVKSLQCYM